jgi:NADH-quinone oxidoreductase subunit G
VVRIKPRPNTAVNQYYICDQGRFDYRGFNRTDRIEAPLVRHHGDRLTAADWDLALKAAATHLNGKRVFALVSPKLSTESLWMISRLVSKSGGKGAFRVAKGPEAPLDGVPDLALRADRAPNAKAAEMFGFTRSDRPLEGMQQGDVLLVADVELTDADTPALTRASGVIVVGTHLSDAVRSAIVVLPATNMAEEDGTFINLRGRVQRYQQAKAAPGMARPVWWAIADLLAFLGEGTSYFMASDTFNAMAQARSEFGGMSYDTLALSGKMLQGASAPAGAAR